MSKRFTDTDKWDDPWFAELSPEYKLLWLYLCDKCNQVGIIDYSKRITEFNIGMAIDINDFVEKSENRVVKLRNGKLFLTKFLDFQVGTVSEKSPAHKPIIKLIEQNPEILEYPIPYPSARVVDTLEDTLVDRVQEKEKEEEKEIEIEKDEEKEEEKKTPHPFASELVTRWNTLASEQSNLACVRTISKSRASKISTRVKEGLTMDQFVKVLEEVAVSDFLLGKGGGWKVTFDWLIENDRNWLKVLEGNYRNTPKYQTPFSGQQFETAQQRRNREIDEQTERMMRKLGGINNDFNTNKATDDFTGFTEAEEIF